MFDEPNSVDNQYTEIHNYRWHRHNTETIDHPKYGTNRVYKSQFENVFNQK